MYGTRAHTGEEKGQCLALCLTSSCTSCDNCPRAKRVQSHIREQWFSVQAIDGYVHHLWLSCLSVKLVAFHTLVNDAVGALPGTNNPISCSVNSSFHEHLTLMLESVMTMFHKKFCGMAVAWNNHRELLFGVQCSMLKPTSYPEEASSWWE